MTSCLRVPLLIALIGPLSATAEVDPNELETLSVEQAREIVGKNKGTLSFRKLPEVSLEVAKVLAGYKGELRLNGLVRLSPEVALALSDQQKGANLCFNALTELSPDVAKSLATRPGGMLSLNALPEVSREVARELANVRGKLTLNGVQTLPLEVARELAKHRSKLTLTGLPEISKEAAEALSVHRGTFLLNGLTRLTSPVLVQNLLTKSDGFVSFKKVETMTDEVAAIFVAYDGKKPISLDSLTQLPPARAAGLRANEKVVLPAHLRKPGIVNSLGMQLAYIPAGKFGMGSPKDEPGRKDEERRHEVRLTREFYLGVHEVTVGQFRAFVRESGYKTDSDKDGKGSWGITPNGKFERDAKYDWKGPGFDQGDDHPVVDVSWNDAKAFCTWLSVKEGKSYRLPTEAEWEYACRAGTRTAYSFGDRSSGSRRGGQCSRCHCTCAVQRVVARDQRQGRIRLHRAGGAVQSQPLRPPRHARQCLGVVRGLVLRRTPIPAPPGRIPPARTMELCASTAVGAGQARRSAVVPPVAFVAIRRNTGAATWGSGSFARRMDHEVQGILGQVCHPHRLRLTLEPWRRGLGIRMD